MPGVRAREPAYGTLFADTIPPLLPLRPTRRAVRPAYPTRSPSDVHRLKGAMAETVGSLGETYVLHRGGPDRFLAHGGGVRFDLAGARRFGSVAEAAAYCDRFGGPERDRWQICCLSPDGRLVPVRWPPPGRPD